MTNNSVSTKSGAGKSSVKYSPTSSLSEAVEILQHNRANSLVDNIYIGKIYREYIKDNKSVISEESLEFLEYIKILGSYIDSKYKDAIGELYSVFNLFRKIVLQLKSNYSDNLYMQAYAQQAIFISKLSDFFIRYAKENSLDGDFDYFDEVDLHDRKIIHRCDHILEKGIIRCSELMERYLPKESYDEFCSVIIDRSNNYSK